jgi:hypothetical protein
MSDRIIVSGRTKLLKSILSQMMATYQLLEEYKHKGLYSMPEIKFHDPVVGKPKIKLVFYQLRHETTNNRPRASGEICYRIPGESGRTFTQANARARAERIKELFTQPSLFIWQKGKQIVSYVDKPEGYMFKLYVKNENEARRIITQVMAIENKIPNWENLQVGTSMATYPEDTGSTVIMGKTYKKPRRRPREDVTFRYAEMHIQGLTKAVTLVDTVGRRGKPLVSVL